MLSFLSGFIGGIIGNPADMVNVRYLSFAWLLKVLQLNLKIGTQKVNVWDTFMYINRHKLMTIA